jgi:hypothetical protein
MLTLTLSHDAHMLTLILATMHIYLLLCMMYTIYLHYNVTLDTAGS